MTKYSVERFGKPVNHVIFIGENSNYKPMDIIPLILESEQKVKELQEIWPDAIFKQIG